MSPIGQDLPAGSPFTGSQPDGPCVVSTRYIFGLDASGNTLLCISYSAGYTEAGAIVWKGQWGQAPPLVGVRVPGTQCSGNSGVAQSPDGKPMMCQNQVWTPHLG
jgi:hypothetical protein